MRTSRQAATDAVALARERAMNPMEVWGIPTGYTTFDKMIGGIQYQPKGTMSILIARPNVGKSGLVGSMALNIAGWFLDEESPLLGCWVGIVTLEMDEVSYQTRMACLLADVPLQKVNSGMVTLEEFHRYEAAHEQLAKLPIRYHTTDDGQSLSQIETFLADTEGGRCGYWFLDHIGLVSETDNTFNSVAAMALVSKRLQRLCHQRVAGMIVAHANRETEKNADKRPTMTSVAGADQLTRDADLILGLYREDMYTQQPVEMRDKVKEAELLVLKNRKGTASACVHMFFHPTRVLWEENKRKNSGLHVVGKVA